MTKLLFSALTIALLAMPVLAQTAPAKEFGTPAAKPAPTPAPTVAPAPAPAIPAAGPAPVPAIPAAGTAPVSAAAKDAFPAGLAVEIEGLDIYQERIAPRDYSVYIALAFIVYLILGFIIAVRKKPRLAVASLILVLAAITALAILCTIASFFPESAIIALVVVFAMCLPIGLVMGHMARYKCRKSAFLSGAMLANASLYIGYGIIGFMALAFAMARK